MTSPSRNRCREMLPDTPRWVETRDLLAAKSSHVMGSSDGQAFVVWNDEYGIGSVVGEPDAGAIRNAGTACPELLAFPDNITEVRRVLDDFTAEIATILEAPAEFALDADHPCQVIDASRIDLIGDIPASMREELEEAIDDEVEVMAAFDGDRPVSFAYVASETETLWDVSIDTLETHRRRGFAAAVVLALAEVMLKQGKTAVWGAAESNPASLHLALKLGFTPVDKLWVLTRKRSGRTTTTSSDLHIQN